tara:strand:+ start:949 stop:1392 length:444 start_codon:yes stop_codon:yes gene_type:complete
MIKYIAKVGNQEQIDKGGSPLLWSDPMDTRKEAREWAEEQFDATQNHESPEYRYDMMSVEEVEVNYTDDEEVAKREGYKPFWINVYESSKHVKLYYAKDSDSLQTDEASEQIHEDWNENAYGEEGGWFWKNGQTDTEIIQGTSEEVA